MPVFCSDLSMANKEILIVSPFLRKRRTAQMIQFLKQPLDKHIQINVITRPLADFKIKDQGPFQSALGLFKDTGIHVGFQSNIHQKFAIIDHRIVWYGSINLLSYGSAQESIMRLESSNIAHELMKNVG